MHPLKENKAQLDEDRKFYSEAVKECEEKIEEIEQYRQTVLKVRSSIAADEQKFDEGTKELKAIKEALEAQRERRVHLKKGLLDIIQAEVETDGYIADEAMRDLIIQIHD